MLPVEGAAMRGRGIGEVQIGGEQVRSLGLGEEFMVMCGVRMAFHGFKRGFHALAGVRMVFPGFSGVCLLPLVRRIRTAAKGRTYQGFSGWWWLGEGVYIH